MKESKLFLNTKTATLAEARALKIGDIIEAVYADSETPRLEMILESCSSAKSGNWYDLRTLPLEYLGKRTAWSIGTFRLNTNKFRKVGNAADVISALKNLPVEFM